VMCGEKVVSYYLEVNGFFFGWYSDMACHIDGFIAAVAHTHVLQEGPITGRAADVIAAANTAAEVALRLVRPGKKVINCNFVMVDLDFTTCCLSIVYPSLIVVNSSNM